MSSTKTGSARLLEGKNAVVYGAGGAVGSALAPAEVKLDLVTRWKAAGRQVRTYFANYDATSDWHLVPAWLDGREAMAVYRSPADARPGYFMMLDVAGERIAAIRDFRYVPYIGRDAKMEKALRVPSKTRPSQPSSSPALARATSTACWR